MPTGTDAGENLATSDWLLAAADAEPSAAESEPAVQRAGLVGVTGAHAEPVLKIDPFTYWLYVTKFEFRAKLAAGEVNCAAQLLPGGAHCAPCTILTGTLAAMQVNKRVSLFTFIVYNCTFSSITARIYQDRDWHAVILTSLLACFVYILASTLPVYGAKFKLQLKNNASHTNTLTVELSYFSFSIICSM